MQGSKDIIRPSMVGAPNKDEKCKFAVRFAYWTYKAATLLWREYMRNLLRGSFRRKLAYAMVVWIGQHYSRIRDRRFNVPFIFIRCLGAALASSRSQLSEIGNRDVKSVFWQKWLPKVSQTCTPVDNTEMYVCVCGNMQFISEQLFRAVQ